MPWIYRDPCRFACLAHGKSMHRETQRPHNWLKLVEPLINAKFRGFSKRPETEIDNYAFCEPGQPSRNRLIIIAFLVIFAVKSPKKAI